MNKKDSKKKEKRKYLNTLNKAVLNSRKKLGLEVQMMADLLCMRLQNYINLECYNKKIDPNILFMLDSCAPGFIDELKRLELE